MFLSHNEEAVAEGPIPGGARASPVNNFAPKPYLGTEIGTFDN
jgi:hypothetical protein